jgi:hypothetical protein
LASFGHHPYGSSIRRVSCDFDPWTTAFAGGYTVDMTIEQLKEIHGSRPFKPFTIHLADGRSFRVEHPEFLSRSPSGRTIVVQQPEDKLSILDLLLVTELEVHPPQAASR